MNKNKKYYTILGKLTVFALLVTITSPKIYSQAQGQASYLEGRKDHCQPHTNTKVDSPSTSTWVKISAPLYSAVHSSELGAHQKFTSVKHEEIYTKVDAVVFINNSSLKSEFIANPGADLHHIMLIYNRARNITINNNEELIHDSEFRRFVLREPVTLQIIDGENKIIDTSYDIDKDGIVSFDIAEYDKEAALIIIPTLNDINEFAEYNKKYEKNIQNYNDELVLK